MHVVNNSTVIMAADRGKRKRVRYTHAHWEGEGKGLVCKTRYSSMLHGKGLGLFLKKSPVMMHKDGELENDTNNTFTKLR